MTTPNADRPDLYDSLAAMTHRHRIAFAASCCQRMLPTYEAFEAIEEWSGSDLLYSGLERAWKYAERGELDAAYINTLRPKLAGLAPDPYYFGTVFARFARPGATSVLLLIDSLVDGDIDRIADIARFGFESAKDFVLCCIMPIDYGRWKVEYADNASSSPLCLSELAKQEYDLRLLRDFPELTPELVHALRESNARLGVRPRMRGLVPGSFQGYF